ncbi:MAG: DUF2891 domain-containing protein, partial [Pseudomonadota bacterium]
MKTLLWGLGVILLAACSAAEGNDDGGVFEPESQTARPDPVTLEDRFAVLALDCVHREYPNKISHVMQSSADVRTPIELTPAFYGCFDWHSSVHGHWLLSRLLNTSPDSVLSSDVRAALAKSLTPENMMTEREYYLAEGRASFERPYGIAWYLQLVLELEESNDPQMTEWRETLRPLENAIVDQISDWLPKLSYPIRLGTHNQTAFAFGLMLDYARGVGNEALEADLVAKTLTFHRDDENCPLAYEPSGEDFLSPCLMEADLIRRVMTEEDFSEWLSHFLPQIPTDGGADWLEPGIVLDASDGKLVHLDGVNLSRAWALEGIANALPDDDERIPALMASSLLHRDV